MLALWALTVLLPEATGHYPACTQAFIDKIYRSVFHSSNGITGCPEADWKNEFFASSLTQQRRDPINIFDIGCNKGLDALNTMNVYTQDFTVTKQAWFEHANWTNCGFCNQCRNEPAPIPGATGKAVRLYCIELLPSNFVRVLENAKHFGMLQRGMRVISGAFTSASDAKVRRWRAGFPDPLDEKMREKFNRHGHESMGIGIRPRCDKCNLTPIPLYVLDSFMIREGLLNIDILSIDTEGNDGLVLEGANRTLSHVKYVEFEVHTIGMWPALVIRDVLQRLEDIGFVCYWLGKRRLWRITDCWHEKYAEHRWSNIGCVKASVKEWYEIMQRYFIKTIPH